MIVKLHLGANFAHPVRQPEAAPFTNAARLTRNIFAYAVTLGGGVAEWPKAAVC